MLWEGTRPQPPTLGAWRHRPWHRFWLRITSFLPNNSQTQPESWHRSGTAPSRQFGCGHPALQDKSLTAWTRAVPLPAAKQPQAHQFSSTDTASAWQCWGQTVKLTDPTVLCKRCIPELNAYFTHCLVFWLRISSVMCRFWIGIVFSKTFSLSLWVLWVAEYIVWKGQDLAICYQAELIQRFTCEQVMLESFNCKIQTPFS